MKYLVINSIQLLGIVGMIIAVSGLFGQPSLAAPPDPDIIPGRFVAILNAGVAPEDVLQGHGLHPIHVYRYAVNGFAVAASDGQVNRLRQDPRVASVGLDRVVRAFDQNIPTGVNRIDSEPGKTGIKTGASVRVAITDTGIDADHPDLQGNLDSIYSCSFLGGKVCGPGFPPAWNDGNGHGSHVAGTVAASNNTQGVVGVAPGATLVALKALNDAGSGSFADITASVDYVTCTHTGADCNNDGISGDLPIQVINMSLGARCSVCTDNSTDPTIAAFHTAVANAVSLGVVVVVAAGNDGANAATTVPASFDEVITVSAFSDLNGASGSSSGCLLMPGQGKVCDETIAKFSNYGADVDIAAPGVRVNSTYKDGGYTDLSGTSMASPHVAGVVALYLEARIPPATASEVAAVRSILRANGECTPGGTTNLSGWCSKKWSGEPDRNTYWEPLVDAERVATLP